MRVTKEIIKAIQAATVKLDSQRELADLCGISQSNLSKYQNGSIKIIREESWAKLYPHIKQYLDAKYHEAPPTESLEMTALLREKISVLEERLKLAAETTASKNTIIHDKNRRINELEVELARMRKS